MGWSGRGQNDIFTEYKNAAGENGDEGDGLFRLYMLCTWKGHEVVIVEGGQVVL